MEREKILEEIIIFSKISLRKWMILLRYKKIKKWQMLSAKDLKQYWWFFVFVF